MTMQDYPVPQQRLWDPFADPRQLERFWGPPALAATFTRHDVVVGGRAQYFFSLPEGGGSVRLRDGPPPTRSR